MEGAAQAFEGLCKVSHATQKHHQALLAGRDVGGLLGHLGHPHGIELGVKPIKSRRIGIELVTQDQHQCSYLAHEWLTGVKF
jgi:hypothetical protein